MSLMSLSEKSDTMRYGLISSKLSQEVTNILQNKSLPDEASKLVLGQGKELLNKFIMGSRLIEGDEFKDGLTPTPDSLTVFPYAVTTLRSLEKLKNDVTVSKTLIKISTFIDNVINLKSVSDLNNEEIDILADFFDILANLFYDDLVNQQLQSSIEPFSKYEFNSNGKNSTRIT